MANGLNQNGSEEATWVFHGPREPPLLDWTTVQLLDFGAQKHPNHTAVISSWQGLTFTYQELQQDVKYLAGVLLASGISHGDRVMVLAGNSIEFVHIYLATTYIGAIFTIINPMFTIKEVTSAIELIGKLERLRANCAFSKQGCNDSFIRTSNDLRFTAYRVPEK
jgi:long-chain acyl-CoA synthetase